MLLHERDAAGQGLEPFLGAIDALSQGLILHFELDHPLARLVELRPGKHAPVGASSEAAGVVEIHEMAMEGNVMRMRPIRSLDLPSARMVELKPGGHHMMLMDLKRPLAAGEKIKVELRLETRDKKLVTQPIEIEVRPRAP